jgi:hypothetical protein
MFDRRLAGRSLTRFSAQGNSPVTYSDAFAFARAAGFLLAAAAGPAAVLAVAPLAPLSGVGRWLVDATGAS